MKPTNQIASTQTGINILTALIAAHPELDVEGISCGFSTDKPMLILHDAALAGEVLGRDGWTRKKVYYQEHYDWHREIDGVTVVISNAEAIPVFNDTPVPPKAFPLALSNAENDSI